MDRRAIYAAERVPVEYIGRKEPWVDKLYGSKLPFNKGQVRVVPSERAIRLLRHEDLFKLAETDTECDEQKQDDSQMSLDPNEGEQDEGDEQDDTDELLDEAEKEQAEAKQREQERQDLVDQVNAMTDKDSLEHFAQTRYQQRINKRKSVENLREDVVGMIDQFGVA